MNSDSWGVLFACAMVVAVVALITRSCDHKQDADIEAAKAGLVYCQMPDYTKQWQKECPK